MFAVVITGPAGAGKTLVLTALVDALSDDDIAHAAIEVEMLEWHAQDLAVSMPALQGVDLVLSTQGEVPEAVADRIRSVLPRTRPRA